MKEVKYARDQKKKKKKIKIRYTKSCNYIKQISKSFNYVFNEY